MKENGMAQPYLNIKVKMKVVQRQEDEKGSQFQQSIALNSVAKESGKGSKDITERNLSRYLVRRANKSVLKAMKGLNSGRI
ncbi:unnamed protein product [Rhizophagus irregularis]|uniref:Uncharacterized protein n=1 Tax=Rhizophagus irregularis TaxID=588596 RepID=A0A2N1M5H2_9GLOM|nr:hypothetical protein RhiirC2_799095 [Rhizophagus irregularis]CAB5381410.1 unnamed protein product [Rhizophagus irregularis]